MMNETAIEPTRVALDEIRRWPKVDLHCHLEGAIRPATIHDLYSRNHGAAAPTLEELLPQIQVTGQEQSLFDFLAKFDAIMPCLKSEADLERITLEVAADAVADGIVYREIRFCPHFIADFTGMSPRAATEAVVRAKEQAEAVFPILLELILIVPQYGGEQIGNETVDLALAYANQGVRAVDVAGDIRQFNLETYGRVFSRAAEAGLGITIHAGEVTPADTVRLAIEVLHANRIGHGIRAVDDPDVISLLRERNVLLEICVTSNLQTRAAPSLLAHPIRQLLDCDVSVSLNTDDPGISEITLSDEYHLLLNGLGLSEELLYQTNLHAIDAAFTSSERKEKIRLLLQAPGREGSQQADYEG